MNVPHYLEERPVEAELRVRLMVAALEGPLSNREMANALSEGLSDGQKKRGKAFCLGILASRIADVALYSMASSGKPETEKGGGF